MRHSACIAVSGLLVLVCAPAPAADWPVMRGSPDNRGVAADVLSPPLRRAWTFEAGGPVEGTAAIVGGTVYIGTMRGKLHAIRLADGKRRWTFTSRDAFSASPCVSNGMVYIGDEGGAFYALDAATGKPRWRKAADLSLIHI